MNQPAGGGDPPSTGAINALVAIGLLALLLVFLLAVQLVRHQADILHGIAGWKTASPASPARPIGSPADWFSDEYYPAAAKKRGLEGRVATVLHVDAHGVVTGCTVVQSSGVEDLDRATCDAATRFGRFRPALDAKGQPVASDVPIPPVRWQLRGE